MSEIVFQVILLAGVWLGVVLLNAVRKCVESLRDTIDQRNIDELRETLQSIESRIDALASDYRMIHPALRNVDDEIY
ncbi:MAG: hypothetical protein OER85_03205 [Gammaproteobacteria bacterium]|nr:hypothetical protein [Gammaproteobacteria bacterium]